MEDAIAQFTAALVVFGIAVMSLLSAVITYVVVPFIRSKTTRQQRETAYGIVVAGVDMAEQLGDTLGLDSNAKKKRAEAWILARFKDLGISVSHDELDGWIEGAVNHLHGDLQSLFDEPEQK